ncbi:MAG: efflux RND transporter permease subunit [Candidatus Heteroscillospira sp.]
MLEKIADALTRRPKLVVLTAVLLLIPSVLGIVGTRINYDILSYLPADLDSSKGEKLLEEPFGSAATTMLIVEDMPPAYTESLLHEVEKVPGVSGAVWVSDLMGIQIPTEMLPRDIRDMFFSDNATMMIVQYEKAGATDETMDAIAQVRRLCNEKCFLAGFSVIIKDTRDLVNREMPLYVALAAVLAYLAMSVTIESWLLPAVLLMGIGLAIVYNFGTNIFLGEISYITQALAAVLQLGVTTDYSIFLYNRYVEERSRCPDNKKAMSRAIVTAFTSLSGSSLTTVAGFLALCFMRLTLGRDIGLVMAKGVVLGIATVVLVLPAMLLVLDEPIHKYTHRTFKPNLDKINGFVVKRRVLLVIIFLALFPFAIYAKNNAPVYYKLDESLPRDMPSIIANEKLKTDFDMASTHFVVFSDELSRAKVKEMEDRIADVPGINAVVAYDKLVSSAIPEFFVPDSIREICKQDGLQMMMVNSEYTTATDQVKNQLDEMNSIIKSFDENACITGEAAMTADLISTADVDFKVTNYISLIAIVLIVAWVFRSVSVPVVLVAAIELSIFLNEGVPYFTNTEVAFVTPTVIGCIQLGATVDYAILMATRLREEIQAGNSRREAILTAAATSDMSIVTSALVLLCSTMGVAFISKIELISSICVMLARGAVISAVMSIFVLPALLMCCEGLFARTSLYWSKPKPVKEKKKLQV